MLNAIRLAGPTGWMMVILALVIAVIAVQKIVQLSRGSAVPGAAWDAGINAILFWGAFAAVLGFLGQCLGIYNAMLAIRQASEISPAVIAEGFFVSFTSTMIGVAILVVSALCWFALRVWANRSLRLREAT